MLPRTKLFLYKSLRPGWRPAQNIQSKVVSQRSTRNHRFLLCTSQSSVQDTMEVEEQGALFRWQIELCHAAISEVILRHLRPDSFWILSYNSVIHVRLKCGLSMVIHPPRAWLEPALGAFFPQTSPLCFNRATVWPGTTKSFQGLKQLGPHLLRWWKHGKFMKIRSFPWKHDLLEEEFCSRLSISRFVFSGVFSGFSEISGVLLGSY